MADTYVQTARLKVPAPARSGFQHPAQGAGVPSIGTPPTALRLSTKEGHGDGECIGNGKSDDGSVARTTTAAFDRSDLIMPVQTVPFVPIFALGGFFLIAPGMVVTLFTNSDALGFAVVVATAVAALVRPTANWILFAVLCSLRTVPFLVAALTAVAMRIGLAKHAWPYLIAYLVLGGVAQLRIRSLRRSGQIEI